MQTMLGLPFKVDNVDLRWIYILTLCKKKCLIFLKRCLSTTPLSIVIFAMHSCALRHLYQGFSVTLFIKGAARRWNQKWPFEDQYISPSVCKLHLRAGSEEKTCLCAAFCSDPASLRPRRCPPYQEGAREIKVLPFLTAFPCSGVTSPGVDNNGVILLSVAASLTLADNFFFSCRSSVSILPWAGTGLNVFPIGVFRAPFRLQPWKWKPVQSASEQWNGTVRRQKENSGAVPLRLR